MEAILVGEQKMTTSYRDLAAIIEHAYYMHIEQKRFVSIKEAKEDFEINCRKAYEIAKIKQDKEEQDEEVKKHKYIRSQQLEHDIGNDVAHCEWTKNYAEGWRKYRESPGKLGFICEQIKITSPSGLHYRPSTSIAMTAKERFCNVFIGHERLEKGDINVDDREYLDITSSVNDKDEGIFGTVSKLLNLTAIKDEYLYLLLTGLQKEEARSAIEYELSKKY